MALSRKTFALLDDAGNSIDGTSNVIKGVWDGTTFTPGVTGGEDIRGPEIN